MFDRDFLIWLHQRLLHQHGEDYNADYMGKLRSIINETFPGRLTPNMAPDIDGEIRVERTVIDIDPFTGRRQYGLTGEITVYLTDPLLYAAMVDGQNLLDEWIEDMLQERVDEEGCGATISAMREWGDD
jgi:hypothetical protein